jgi:hypothetical protein
VLRWLPYAVSFGASAFTVANDVALLDVPVSLDSPAPAGGLTIPVDGADGTAVSRDDYGAAVGAIFAPGETSSYSPISVNGAVLYDNDETFTITLNPPSGG